MLYANYSLYSTSAFHGVFSTTNTQIEIGRSWGNNNYPGETDTFIFVIGL